VVLHFIGGDMLIYIILAIIIFWVLGGQWKGSLRDVPVPILMGIGIWLATKSWLVGLISIGLWQIIRLGYGNYEKGEKNSFLGNLTKDNNGWWIRAIYGLIVALVGCGALFALKFLSLPEVFTYIIGNTIIGYSVSKFRFNVWFTDILISAGFASLIFLL
jgi:hypothetical protein